MRFLCASIFVSVCLWLAGCAGWGKDAAPPDHVWTRTMERVCEGDRDAVWKAVLQALADYPVKQRDPVKGVAVTGWKNTLAPHDMAGPPGMIIVQPKGPDGGSETLRTPPRWLRINFEVKRRLTVSLTETAGGKQRVSVTRQMYISYFDAPKGSMNPGVYERLRGDFDTGEELSAVLRNILDAAEGKTE